MPDYTETGQDSRRYAVMASPNDDPLKKAVDRLPLRFTDRARRLGAGLGIVALGLAIFGANRIHSDSLPKPHGQQTVLVYPGEGVQSLAEEVPGAGDIDMDTFTSDVESLNPQDEEADGTFVLPGHGTVVVPKNYR